MGLFIWDHDRPGPGVPKNAPRKTGPARFFEILGREFGNLIKLNLLVFLCSLPALALFAAAMICLFAGYGTLFLLLALLAVVTGGMVGPAYTTMCALIAKMLRDDPGFFWHDFKKKFKENFRGTFGPGMLFSLLAGAQLFVFFFYVLSDQTIDPLMLVGCVLITLLLALAAPYYFTQAACLELRPVALLKNSLILAFARLPRSFAGALLGPGLLVVQLFFLPVSIIVTLLLGYAIPCLLNLMWIWPVIDKTFRIEETLKNRQEEQSQSD